MQDQPHGSGIALSTRNTAPAWLLLRAQSGHELALQTLNDDQDFCLHVPCPDGAWPTSFSGVCPYMLNSAPPCLGGE